MKRAAAAAPPADLPRGVPAEVLRQVRRIELRTRRLVNSRFQGEYHSVFKGQGIEFAEVREYEPGDDVRTIDWNVTGRMGKPFVKKFVEERELTVFLAVDLSGSQQWGTRTRFKSELVAEIAATIALSAVRNNDRVGLLIFTDRVELLVPPRKGRRHVLRLIRELLASKPRGRGTDHGQALRQLTRGRSSRSILFLFSDFQVNRDWAEFERALARASFRHDLVAVNTSDPADAQLPDVGLLEVVDPETGRTVVVNTSDPSVVARYTAAVDEERRRLTRIFRKQGIDEIEIRTDLPYSAALVGFFARRERRLRR
jgi:uncharacterized protein (DUF58 family)